MGNIRTKSSKMDGGLIRSGGKSKISKEGPDDVQLFLRTPAYVDFGSTKLA